MTNLPSVNILECMSDRQNNLCYFGCEDYTDDLRNCKYEQSEVITDFENNRCTFIWSMNCECICHEQECVKFSSEEWE